MIHELLAGAGSALHDRAPDRATWDLGETPPADLCAALALLKEDLVEAVVFRPAQGDWRVRLGRHDGNREVQFSRSAPGRLEILLSATELERWLFFLKYFRDGTAEVDHLDVAGSLGRDRLDLALKVPRAKPPVDADEARRRLRGR